MKSRDVIDKLLPESEKKMVSVIKDGLFTQDEEVMLRSLANMNMSSACGSSTAALHRTDKDWGNLEAIKQHALYFFFNDVSYLQSFIDQAKLRVPSAKYFVDKTIKTTTAHPDGEDPVR